MKFTILLTIIATAIVACSQPGPTKLQGEYKAEYAVGGGAYRTSFTFFDSTYFMEFFFTDEEELVWRCNGSYSIAGNILFRRERRCEFLRSEEPQGSISCGDLKSEIQNLTDTSFTIHLDKIDNGVPDTSLWLKFKKKGE